MNVKAEIEIMGDARFWYIAPGATPPDGVVNYIIGNDPREYGDLYLNGKKVGKGIVSKQEVENFYAYDHKPIDAIVTRTVIQAILEF